MLIYATAGMVVFAGLCVLAVDWGRVQVAKTELQRTADAAAPYAVTGVSDGTALAKANWIGGLNPADGRAVVFQAADVTTGTWDASAGAFAAGGGSPNPARVTARRSAAAGTAVPLTFGPVIGVSSSDVVVQAVAK